MAYSPFPVNTISTANSSTATLTSGSVFTGTSEDVSSYSEVRISCVSDVASATNGVSIQQSSNGTNWDITDTYTAAAGVAINVGIGVSAQFFRIVYTNGGTNQAYFRLQCVFHGTETKASSVRPQDNRSNETDTEEVSAFNMVYDPTNNVWNRMSSFMYLTGQSAQTAIVNNILNATSGAASTDVQSYKSFTCQVVSTGTAGTFIFEGSNDNVNFTGVPIYNISTAASSPGLVAITASSSNIIYLGACMFRYLRLRIVTTITGGSIQAFSNFTQSPFSSTVTNVVQGTAANLATTATIASGTVTTLTTLTGTTTLTPGTAAANLGKAEDAVSASGDTGVFVLGVRRDAAVASASATGDYNEIATNKWGAILKAGYELTAKTFSCSANITVAVSATDIAILPGNATNTAYVTKVIISGIQTTAGSILVQLIKRSSANSGGTSAAMTAIPHDSGDAAAVSAPLSYTANPTPGASVGNIRTQYLELGSATAIANELKWEFGDKGKQVVLSGVAQGLAINLNGVTVAGGVINVTFEWLEL